MRVAADSFCCLVAFIVADGVTNWGQVAAHARWLLGHPALTLLWASRTSHAAQTAARLQRPATFMFQHPVTKSTKMNCVL